MFMPFLFLYATEGLNFFIGRKKKQLWEAKRDVHCKLYVVILRTFKNQQSKPVKETHETKEKKVKRAIVIVIEKGRKEKQGHFWKEGEGGQPQNKPKKKGEGVSFCQKTLSKKIP